MARHWASGSRQGISVHSNCHRQNAIVYACPYHIPTAFDIIKRSPTRRHIYLHFLILHLFN
jgi:hypothetical protein